jgi:hypothetical protein
VVTAESPRLLTNAERGVLDFILAQDWDGAEQVRAMLQNTRASLGCECGCGSIDLTVDVLGEPLRSRSPVPAEAFAHFDGHPFLALLFIDVDSGFLEFVWFGDPAGRLPRYDELQPRA